MNGGVLGVAGDILSVAFLCFLCSLAIQLYCAFSRRSTRPPTPLPSTISTPPPAAACKQLYLLRSQRSASCPVVSTITPPLSPPNKLSSAYHVNPMACSLASDASPLACTLASQAHTADLAKLMQMESGEEQYDVDVENFICVPPPRMLFTIKEESKDEDATEQSNVASSEEGSSADSTYRNAAATELSSQVPGKCAEPLGTCAQAPANGSVTCAHALLSQVSSASSEGGVSLWSSSPSPAVSYLSASSSPFPTTSPPRSSFWAQSSTLLYTKARFSNATN